MIVVVVQRKETRVDLYSPAKIKQNRACPGTNPTRASLGSDITTVAPDGILMQGRWLPTPKRLPEVAVVIVCFQSYRVDPYSLAKITENRIRPRNRPDWAVFESDFTTVAPNGILRQGQRLQTPNRPPEVAAVFVLQKDSPIDLICKKNRKSGKKFDPTRQSGCFFMLG
ncbi:hypothetical protein CRG98_023088 [Punica granatum]|uniref:Uncharacterized protein n=1 Tax=Punica granatum TaxID=22663 RepID=A0A2I0JJX9_PUNGR|nr:hypothetical protein CRG98_023088 [Punica granatum]